MPHLSLLKKSPTFVGLFCKRGLTIWRASSSLTLYCSCQGRISECYEAPLAKGALVLLCCDSNFCVVLYISKRVGDCGEARAFSQLSHIHRHRHRHRHRQKIYTRSFQHTVNTISLSVFLFHTHRRTQPHNLF